MVLSNYKCMHTRIQNSRMLFQWLQVHSSNGSSNRIKIQEILSILQLETDYFSKLFISEMHSKQWHYSLHRDFQNCYSTRRSLTKFFSSNSSSNSSSNTTHAHYTTIQRILHPESNSTCRRQRALRVLQSRNSTHRRQGDLLEMHPCVLQDLPVVPDIPVIPDNSRDIPGIPVIHDLPAFPGNSTMFQYLQGIHPIPAFSD